MKDSQQFPVLSAGLSKYIKANNERFSTLKGTVQQMV